MNERISDKVQDLERFLEELVTIVPSDLEAYMNDYKAKAACERYAERIIECMVDLAFLLLKAKKLPVPENEGEAFIVLARHGVISQPLAARLKQAKSMRNILAHEYGEVDDTLVFPAIKEELIKDVQEFLSGVAKI